MDLKTKFINLQTTDEVVYPSQSRGYSITIPPSKKKIPIGDHSFKTIGMQGARLPQTSPFDAGLSRNIGRKHIKESPLVKAQREQQRQKKFKTKTDIITIEYISKNLDDPFAPFSEVTYCESGEVKIKIRKMWRFSIAYPYVAFIYKGASPSLQVKIGLDDCVLRRGIPLYRSVKIDSTYAEFRTWIFGDKGEQHGDEKEKRKGRDRKKINSLLWMKRKKEEVAKLMEEEIEKKIEAGAR